MSLRRLLEHAKSSCPIDEHIVSVAVLVLLVEGELRSVPQVLLGVVLLGVILLKVAYPEQVLDVVS